MLLVRISRVELFGLFGSSSTTKNGLSLARYQISCLVEKACCKSKSFQAQCLQVSKCLQSKCLRKQKCFWIQKCLRSKCLWSGNACVSRKLASKKCLRVRKCLQARLEMLAQECFRVQKANACRPSLMCGPFLALFQCSPDLLSQQMVVLSQGWCQRKIQRPLQVGASIYVRSHIICFKSSFRLSDYTSFIFF